MGRAEKYQRTRRGGKRPLSGLNMKGFRLREGPHRSLCQVGCLGLPRIVAFEVRQRQRGIVGSGTEPDGSGSREGLRIGIIKGLFAWAGKYQRSRRGTRWKRCPFFFFINSPQTTKPPQPLPAKEVLHYPPCFSFIYYYLQWQHRTPLNLKVNFPRNDDFSGCAWVAGLRTGDPIWVVPVRFVRNVNA